MELTTWKTLWQVLVAFGGLAVLVGSLASYLIDVRLQKGRDEIERRETVESRELIQKLSLEKDQAVEKLNALSAANLALTKFQGQLDDQVKQVFIRFELDRPYLPETLTGFKAFVWYPRLVGNYEFEMSSLDGSKAAVSLIHKAWDGSGFSGKPTYKEEVDFYPAFSALLFDLWFLGRPSKPEGLKLRDLHASSFRLYVSSNYAGAIKRVQIAANGWIVYDEAAPENAWSKVVPKSEVLEGSGKMLAFERFPYPNWPALLLIDLHLKVPRHWDEYR